MFGNLSGPTLLVIVFIVLLLFGAPKLPALAKSLGQSMKILKKEVRSSEDGDAADAKNDGRQTQQQAPTAGPAPAAGTAAPGAETPGTAASPGAESPGAPGPDAVQPRPEERDDRA
jgi:sec-independent protein translocase protein TatA